MNAPDSIVARETVAGGIFAGRFFLGAEPYGLIIAPKDGGELAETKWGGLKSVAGALSYSDGLANTKAMAEAGSKLGKWALDLRIAGYDDWYIPSRLEALIAFGEVPDEFEKEWYWTSSQAAWDAQFAWCQSFSGGYQGYYHKGLHMRARAVRRYKI